MTDIYSGIIANLTAMEGIEASKQNRVINEFQITAALRKQNMERELTDLFQTNPNTSLEEILPTVTKYDPMKGLEMRSTIATSKLENQKLEAANIKSEKDLGDKALLDMETQVEGLLKNVLPGDKAGFAKAMELAHKTMGAAQQLNSNYTTEQIDMRFENKFRSIQTPEMKQLLDNIAQKNKNAIDNTKPPTLEQDRQYQLALAKLNSDSAQASSGSNEGQPTTIRFPNGRVISSTYYANRGTYLLDGQEYSQLPEGTVAANKSDTGRSLATSRFLGIPVTQDQAESLERNQKEFQVVAQSKYIETKANLDKMLLNLKTGDQKGLANSLRESGIMYQIAISSNEAGARLTDADLKNTTFGSTAAGVLANYKRYVMNKYSTSDKNELIKFAEVSKIVAKKANEQIMLASIDPMLSTSGIPYGTYEYTQIRNALFTQITKRDVPTGSVNGTNKLNKSQVRKLGVEVIPDTPTNKPKTNQPDIGLGTVRG